ncbi:MAG TPA: tetratricopeptide repeat protein [candidate division Zixibacteria bacterium]|nr:tetratricopeptide repeat protein [candidate division Zixibacteria bacterium]
MIIRRTPPRRPRRGPSCLLVLLVIAALAGAIYIVSNIDRARDQVEALLPDPTPEPTRSAASYAASAALLERDGDYEAAVGAYEQALQLDGSRVEFYIPLIQRLLLLGKPDDALSWAEQAVILAPDSDKVWSVLAGAQLANGERLDEIGDPTNADLMLAESVQSSRTASEINPANAEAFAYLAGALAQLGPAQFSGAQNAAEIALALDPDNPIVRLHMATVLELQGFYESAIEQYQVALDQNPDIAELYIGLAYNFYALNDIPTAILTFQDALDADPDNADALDGLGWMFFLIGEYPTAEENLARAVDLDPEMVRGHAHLGAAYYRNLNYDSAIPELETAIERYQNVTLANSTYFNMLGLAYYFKDEANCSQATPLFERVLATIPEDIYAIDGLERCRAATLSSSP